jgi:transcriptional regulator with PAS, ATPase and Fis domain
LLESELFGYAEGAFTGAAKGGKSGLFELAHRGTIFLDEISEISLFIQGRLLRVLEEREIMRLGHDTVVPVDIRIIAATNKDLRQLVSSGAFREDLLYRLDVLRLSIPPVRHRGDDLQLLVRHFLASFFGQRGEAVKEIGTDGWNFLLRQQWEGNVRQIRNFCERLAVISKKQHINSSEVRDAYGSEFGLGEQTAVSGRLKEETDERTHILNILSQTGFAKGEAARILGVDRSTLWRKMKRLGID